MRVFFGMSFLANSPLMFVPGIVDFLTTTYSFVNVGAGRFFGIVIPYRIFFSDSGCLSRSYFDSRVFVVAAAISIIGL